MKKNIFIAPYQELFTSGQKMLRELGLTDKFECFFGDLTRAIPIARKAEREGVDVIVSRGGTAELIEKAVEVPVVEIPIAFQDLAEALVAAKAATKKENPKLAIMAFQNMMRSIEVFAKVMDVELKIYSLKSEEEIFSSIQNVINDNPDVLIGGIHTTEIAAKHGLKTIALTSGEESLRSAFLQAERVSFARQLEKERMQRFRVMIDYSVQGIISIDRNKRIEFMNVAAEKLIGLSLREVKGKSLETMYPDIPLGTCLEKGKVQRGEFVQLKGKKFMANVIPIDIEKSIIGAMVTLEDVGHIVEMEATIRNKLYTKGLLARYHFNDIVGISPQLAEVKEMAENYADIDATVMILGASGTGKELFAQSIHNASQRRKRPFVAVNCGAIPASILESEMFGYVEGAFTGANKKGKAGFFELAHGGTIFLDEIGEMNKAAQMALLRVIQERRIMRLGDDKYLPVDVRIITATNKNLAQLVADGEFREDLYYRINVLPLQLPSLKERSGDPGVLAEHFVHLFNKRFQREVVLSEEAKNMINAYEWPGNIRQLLNVMERIVIVAKEKVVSGTLLETMLDASPLQHSPKLSRPALKEIDLEKDKILRVLEETNYNQKEASRRLGINRSTLYRKLKAYNISLRKTCNS